MTAGLLAELASRGVTVTLTVRGTSMCPALRDGDVVTIAPARGATVPIGAVVAAEVPAAGGLVLHRAVGRCGGGVLLRGDNAARPDGIVADAAVLGLVVRVEREGRPTRLAPVVLRRPLALLVRLGFRWHLNRLKGRARSLLPQGAFASSGRRQGAEARGRAGCLGSAPGC